jgi:hypothetical protein
VRGVGFSLLHRGAIPWFFFGGGILAWVGDFSHIRFFRSFLPFRLWMGTYVLNVGISLFFYLLGAYLLVKPTVKVQSTQKNGKRTASSVKETWIFQKPPNKISVVNTWQPTCGVCKIQMCKVKSVQKA